MPDFPKPTRDDWLKRAPNAGHALQGRIEGPRAFRPTQSPWKILVRVDHADLSSALKQAEDDLAQGADGLVLASAHLVPILKNLPLHKVSVFNEAGEAGAEAIATLIETLPLDPQRLNIDFGTTDSILIKRLITQGFTGPFMRADGRVGHAHGLTDAQDLGATLSMAKNHLKFLGGHNSQAVSMTLAASQNTFETLAKFRAARILWKQLFSNVPLALHAETSRMMMAEVDAHSNILRAVTAVSGAGLGGADSICVMPFSAMQGTANSFARRVARNIHMVLLHETHLWRVEDPAGGAGYVEMLTQEFCEEALDVMRKADQGDWPVGDRDLSPVRPIVGVSKYQNSIQTKAEVESETAPLPPSGYSPNKLGERPPRVLPPLLGEVPEGRWGPFATPEGIELKPRYDSSDTPQ